MSRNIQPYNIAFSGLVPPIRPQSPLNDEFKAQHPSAGVGFVTLDPSWKTFDPGTAMTASRIDVQRQMMYLQGNGNGVWMGRYKDLPVPALDTALQYAIYARVVSPGFVATDEDFGDVLAGMLIAAGDLNVVPLTADLISVHANVARTGGTVQAQMEASYFSAYNAPNAPAGTMLSGTPLGFVRARIQSINDDGIIDSRLNFDVSPDGDGWMQIYALPLATRTFTQVLFGQRSAGGVALTSFFDFLRLDFGSYFGTTGARQQLGSV